MVAQAGALLLTETLRAAGLERGLSVGLAGWRRPRAVHDPGKVVADLAVTLALGGDCLADVAMLRAQPELFGSVASDPTVSRLIDALAATPARALKALRAARAAARERTWTLAGGHAPGAGGEPIPVDVDATVVTAYSRHTPTTTSAAAKAMSQSWLMTTPPTTRPPAPVNGSILPYTRHFLLLLRGPPMLHLIDAYRKSRLSPKYEVTCLTGPVVHPRDSRVVRVDACTSGRWRR